MFQSTKYPQELKGIMEPAIKCDWIIPFPRTVWNMAVQQIYLPVWCACRILTTILISCHSMALCLQIQSIHITSWKNHNLQPLSKVTDLFNHQLRREEKAIPILSHWPSHRLQSNPPSTLSCHKFPTWLQKSQQQAQESELSNPRHTACETLDIALPTGCNPNLIVIQWPQIADLIAKHKLINFTKTFL